MALFYIIYTILLTGIFANPVTEKKKDNLFISSIKEHCQNTTELEKNQSEIFEICKNFEEINKTTIVSKENTQNVLCQLYYDRLISYCKTNPIELKYPTIKEVVGMKYDIILICTSAVNYSATIFPQNGMTKLMCLRLCDNYTEINPHCLLANFYNNAIQESRKTTDIGHSIDSQTNSEPPKAAQLLQKTHNQPHAETKLSESLPAALGQNPPVGHDDTASKSVPKNTGSKNASSERGSKHLETAKTEDTESANKPGSSTSEKPVIQEQLTSNKNKEKGSKKDSPNNSGIHENAQIGNTEPVEKVETDNSMEAGAEGEEEPSKAGKSSILTEPEERKEIDDTVDRGQDGDTVDNYDIGNDPADKPPQQLSNEEVKQSQVEKKPDNIQDDPVVDNLDEIDGESYFLSYFMVICVLVVLGYVGYHNRIKVMALLLEGKRNNRHHRGRRPNSANYHKLDSNLEEAISSNVTKNSNNVIY